MAKTSEGAGLVRIDALPPASWQMVATACESLAAPPPPFLDN